MRKEIKNPIVPLAYPEDYSIAIPVEFSDGTKTYIRGVKYFPDIPAEKRNAVNPLWYPMAVEYEESVDNANTVLVKFYKKLACYTKEERRAMGYMLDIDLDASAKCAITGMKSAVYAICAFHNGTTQEDGSREKYVAIYALPVINTDTDRMFLDYHFTHYSVRDLVGHVRKGVPLINGIELEGNFKTFTDMVYYKDCNIWLNVYGVLGTILLSLARYNPRVTRDCTVHFELLLRPIGTLNGIQDQLYPLKPLLDMESAFGSHIHVSKSTSDMTMVWNNRDALLKVAKDVFGDMLTVMDLHKENTEAVSGRELSYWCGPYVGQNDHNSGINITNNHLEFRFPKYQEAAQYLNIINLVNALTMEFDKVLTVYLENGDNEAYQKRLAKTRDSYDKRGRLVEGSLTKIWNKYAKGLPEKLFGKNRHLINK